MDTQQVNMLAELLGWCISIDTLKYHTDSNIVFKEQCYIPIYTALRSCVTKESFSALVHLASRSDVVKKIRYAFNKEKHNKAAAIWHCIVDNDHVIWNDINYVHYYVKTNNLPVHLIDVDISGLTPIAQGFWLYTLYKIMANNVDASRQILELMQVYGFGRLLASEIMPETLREWITIPHPILCIIVGYLEGKRTTIMARLALLYNPYPIFECLMI